MFAIKLQFVCVNQTFYLNTVLFCCVEHQAEKVTIVSGGVMICLASFFLSSFYINSSSMLKHPALISAHKLNPDSKQKP